MASIDKKKLLVYSSFTDTLSSAIRANSLSELLAQTKKKLIINEEFTLVIKETHQKVEDDDDFGELKHEERLYVIRKNENPPLHDQAQIKDSAAKNENQQTEFLINQIKELQLKIHNNQQSNILEFHDPSADILHVLRTKVEKVPLLQELPQFLNTPLPTKIPVFQKYFQSWSNKLGIPENIMASVFESSNRHCEDLMSSFIGVALISPPMQGSTEDSCHLFWDSIITAPLQKFCPSLKFSRNSNRGTSTSSSRPDVVCTIDGLAVFRSEEKGPNGTNDPREELSNKLQWTYEGLPYILGYYAIEDRVTFVALEKDSNLHTISETFYLTQPADRFKTFIAIRNIASILVALTNMITVRCTLSETEEITRDSGKKIKRKKENVVKIYPKELTGIATKITKFYETLASTPFLDRLVHSTKVRNNNKPTRLVFSPVGEEQKPKSASELVIAIWCVLCAVQEIHKHKIMHRDIRWPNVLKYTDSTAWFLIDLDDACEFPAPKTKTPSRLNKETHAPEIFSEDYHDSAVDLWSIGYLMYECGVTKSVRLRNMQDRLLQDNPKARPSVEECLKIITEEAAEKKVELPKKIQAEDHLKAVPKRT